MWLRRLAKLLLVVVLLVAGAVVVSGLLPFRKPDALPPGAEGRWLEVLGSRLRVEQRGSGPDILLIHGSPGSLEDWRPLRDRLAGDFRVTAYDRPGHGHSDARGTVSVAENARVARALAERLELRAATVVGHSYGGAVALALALDPPPSMRAFVTVGGALMHHRSGEVAPVYRVVALPLLGPGLARLTMGLVGPRELERGVRQAFAPNHDSMPDGFVERSKRLWLTTTVAVTTARERVGIGREQERELAPRYSSIAARVVLVHGRADRLVSVEQSRAAARLVPRAKLLVLDGVGHYVQYARPDELARIVREAAASH